MTVVGTAEVYVVGKDEFTPALKKGADDAAKEIGDKTEKAAGRGRAAFKAAFGNLRTAFGPALGPLGEIYDKFENIGEAASQMRGKAGKALIGIGGTAAIVGTTLQLAGDKDKIAQNQLKSAIDATGGSWEEYEHHTEELIKSGEHYGHTAEETQTALKNITLRTNDAKGAYENMTLVTNLAAAKHISLAAAGDVVAKIMNGNTRVMKQYGISQADVAKAAETNAQKHLDQRKAFDEARIATLKETIATTNNKDEKAKAKKALALYKDDLDKTNKSLKDSVDKHAQARKALEILSNRMKGQASDSADTFTGKLKNIRATTEDYIAQVGQKFGPALTAAGPVMMGFGAIMELGIGEKVKKAKDAIKAFNAMETISQTIKKVSIGINTALGLSETAALGPILLIVAAIALLVAGVVIAYIKIKPFHDLVNAIAKDIATFFVAAWHKAIDAFHAFVNAFEAVWKFIVNIVKRYGLIILTVVAPFIGLPILIYKNWSRIVAWLEGIWQKVSSGVSNAVNTIVRWISNLATRVWNGWVNIFTRVRTIISNGLSDIVRFFAGMPARIAQGFSNLASTVWNTVSVSLGNIKKRIVGYFSGANAWLYNAGRDIITGMLHGVGSLAGTIGNFFLSKVPGFIKAPLKKALGIASPSTVFAEYGRNVMQGFMVGVQGQARTTSNTMSAIMGGLARTGGVQPIRAAAGVGGGRVVNLFPGATVGMREPADADIIVKRLETMISGSRL